MEYYIGLDVSQRQTAICIVDGVGQTVKKGKALTVPSDIHCWIIKNTFADQLAGATGIKRLGLLPSAQLALCGASAGTR